MREGQGEGRKKGKRRNETRGHRQTASFYSNAGVCRCTRCYQLPLLPPPPAACASVSHPDDLMCPFTIRQKNALGSLPSGCHQKKPRNRRQNENDKEQNVLEDRGRAGTELGAGSQLAVLPLARGSWLRAGATSTVDSPCDVLTHQS